MIIIIIGCIATFVLVSLWLGRQSGVTNTDKARLLPGDEIITRPAYIADRATVIHASADEVWPWLVQLGKGRAGWYAPVWLERLLVWNPKKWGARTVLPQFQRLKPGDVVPDRGPGVLEVIALTPEKVLLYGSVQPRDKKGQYLFSWVHVLEETTDHSCRLYTRLRIRRSSWLFALIAPFAGLIDWATMIVMYAGLKYNVALKKR